MTVVPIENSDPHGGALEHVISTLQHQHERVTLIRDGEPVAVVLDPLELQGLEDTIALLSSPEASAALDEALAEADSAPGYSADDIAQQLRERSGGTWPRTAGTNPRQETGL